MFKSKGAIVGVAAALAASVLLVAGMAVTSTSGAATDTPFGGAPSGFPDLGNPPAADEDPAADPGTNPPAGSPAGTAPGTQPSTGIDPTGGAGAGGAAPGSLPNAGFGDNGSGGVAATVILLALAGAALVGAGATAVGTRRS